MVDEKPVGIVRLDETIDEVRALGLSQDAGIHAALMQRISQYNYIPSSAGDAYAQAVPVEFYARPDKAPDGASADKLLPARSRINMYRGL